MDNSRLDPGELMQGEDIVASVGMYICYIIFGQSSIVQFFLFFFVELMMVHRQKCPDLYGVSGATDKLTNQLSCKS